MSAGVGIDLIEVARVERALERRPRLAERLFDPSELAYARSRARPGRHLAARFAAKEATIKALGLTAPVGMREIVVEAGEPPRLRLAGAAADAAREEGVRDLRLSLTHAREMAAAIVISEKG